MTVREFLDAHDEKVRAAAIDEMRDALVELTRGGPVGKIIIDVAKRLKEGK